MPPHRHRSPAAGGTSEKGGPVFHGYLCEGLSGGENFFQWDAPKQVFESSALARPGYDESITAHEYEDSDDVLREKALVLLRMLEHAKIKN